MVAYRCPLKKNSMLENEWLPIAANLKRTAGCETNGCLSLSTEKEQHVVK
jgi:hypothetical protein